MTQWRWYFIDIVTRIWLTSPVVIFLVWSRIIINFQSSDSVTKGAWLSKWDAPMILYQGLGAFKSHIYLPRRKTVESILLPSKKICHVKYLPRSIIVQHKRQPRLLINKLLFKENIFCRWWKSIWFTFRIGSRLVTCLLMRVVSVTTVNN